ncbi:uncharacterized protein LOC119454018 [Dermacentor silvarum]|uniref:uncharacterized protein LOC119454018 n=1 Tax=Dermacentor silvarum TaxID=543639 RepID=UPI001898F5A0|nr:uncharacterized protein LOC119454018 [Dermacentor silvarum]
MNYAVANAGMLAEAVESSSSLTSLTIFGIASDQPEVIRESAVKVCSLDYSGVFPHDYVHSLESMPIPVHLLEQRAARLTSLDVAELHMSPFRSTKLIAALIKNHTITEIAVGACVFASGPFDGPSPSFEKYLLKENATLRKLTLRGSHFDDETVWLPNLAQAISTMTTLQELDADWLGTSQHCELFFIVVSRNRFLRSLTLQLGGMDDIIVEQQRRQDVAAVNDRSWVSALQENSALQKLDLDLSWSTTENCCFLVRALANNHCLQSLTLRYLPDVDRLEEVCCAIRKSGLVNRVYIPKHCVESLDAAELSDFPEVTSITVHLIHLDDAARMQGFFQCLVACNYISSLGVTLNFFDESVCASLATYIKGASALKEIMLKIDFDIIDEWDGDDDDLFQSISNLCKALCSNLGITRITLDWLVELCDEDCQALAHAVLSNRRLHELTVKFAQYDNRAALLRHLLPRFHQNYSLLRLEMPACIQPYANIFAAQEIVRRNCSLIERATRFVLGDHDPYCARAVEFVSEHPKLVDNVRREAALSDEAEAVALIRGAVRRLCLADVHEFMRLTGVVQERVVCHAREDGATQFDKLSHDCWLHIRRYLTVADVVEPGGPLTSSNSVPRPCV